MTSTLLAAAVVVAGATLTVAAPASALTAPVGPTDPTNGFPTFYTDDVGVSLQQCLSGPPCLALAGPFTAPGGEAFYYNASTTAGGFKISEGVEMAFFAGSGQQITFQRTQASHQGVGLTPGATYTLTDPYGSFPCKADAAGTIPNNNACRLQTGGTTPLDFATTLTGRVSSYLTWDTVGQPAPAGPPVGFIGDGVTPHAVVGSPTGFNSFQVTGPGVTPAAGEECLNAAGATVPDCAQSPLWVVAGKTIAGPVGALSASSLAFSNTAVGSVTPTQTLKYSSIGTSNATITSVTVGGPQAADFKIVNDAASCVAPAAVSPGSSCDVLVIYAPSAPGPASATLTITDDASSTPRSIPLTGSSVGVLSVPTTPVAFGLLRVGATASKTVAVTNTGVASMVVATPTATGPYAATAGTCGTPLAVGASCSVTVTAQPVGSGPQSGTLTLTSGGISRSVSLTGSAAIGLPVMTPGSVRFGDTAPGSSSSSETLTVTNTGTVPLLVGSSTLVGADAAHFDLQQGTCGGTLLGVGSSCILPVGFSPGTPGLHAATVSTTTDAGVITAALSGTGVAPGSPPPAADRTAPSAPGSVTATRSGRNVTLAWSASTDAVGVARYQVLRDGVVVADSIGRSYVDALVPQGVHAYRLRALDAAGNVGDLSAPVIVDVVGVRPFVRQHSPSSGASLVKRTANVTERFSEGVGGVTSRTVVLVDARTGKKVASRVSYDARTRVAIVNPVKGLASHRKYRVTTSGAIKDVPGNSLAAFSWTFTTGR